MVMGMVAVMIVVGYCESKWLVRRMLYHFSYLLRQGISVMLFWWSLFVPSRNFDEVFTYNNMYVYIRGTMYLLVIKSDCCKRVLQRKHDGEI